MVGMTTGKQETREEQMVWKRLSAELGTEDEASGAEYLSYC